MIASVGLVLASYIPRRAYATAVIVGVFVLTFTVATILMETLDTTVRPVRAPGEPGRLGRHRSSGSSGWTPPSGNVISDASFSGWVYFVAGVVTIAVALGLTVRRFQRIQA